MGGVAIHLAPVTFARYERLPGLDLYYLVVLGELVNVDFPVFRFTYANPYVGLTVGGVKMQPHALRKT